MKRLSLRWMLLLPIMATVIIGFISFAVAVDVSERSVRLSEIDLELTRADVIPVPPPAAGGTAPDAPIEIESLDDDSPLVQLVFSPEGAAVGAPDAANPFSSAAIAELSATASRSTMTIEGYRALVTHDPNGLTRVTALSLESYDGAIASLRRTLFLGGLLILLVEAVVVWVLARRLAQPLAMVTKDVARVADGALDTPIRSASGSREIAELSTDLGRMVTRLREALAEREQSAADAMRARDDMRRLLADVAHEIRTPLTALKGYSDLFAQGMLGEAGALDRAMLRVGDESMRMHELVNSMLQLAREGTAPESIREQIDLVQVARNVVSDLRVAFPGRELNTDLHEAHDVPLLADAARIHQALLNLVGNACRHTPADTPISVLAAVSSTEVAISVVDHGPGIAAAEREKIFLPFYQTDPSRTRHVNDGAGLGLAVSLQIAEDHCGSITLSETPHGGATFTLRLPLDSGDSPGTGATED